MNAPATPCICPCDCDPPAPPANPPGLSTLSYRVGDFAEFRRALVIADPRETELSSWPPNPAPGDPPTAVLWRPGAQGDLALMMAEWWAYLADILTFYNERHANQQYLGTADLPGSVNRLIRLLGYRPQPALAARATLAALVSQGRSVVLPRGLQIQSKPAPGQQPQIFELDADTAIGGPDVTPALPPQSLQAPDAGLLLLQGAVSAIHAGAHLALRPRDGSSPALVTVTGNTVEVLPDRSKQTRLTVQGAIIPDLAAADARLERPGQSSGLWSYHPSYALQTVTTTPGYQLSNQLGYAVQSHTSIYANSYASYATYGGYGYQPTQPPNQLHLSGLARQIRPGDLLLLTAPGLSPVLVTVSEAAEVVWYANATSNPATAPAAPPQIALPHTRLTITPSLPAAWDAAATGVTVWFAWSEAAKLKDQPVPVWSGAPTTLQAIAPARFRKGVNLPVLIGDAAGGGATAKGSSDGDGAIVLSALDDPFPALPTPLDVYANLLQVSRGKTVAREVLGSGLATAPGQSFTLAKSPVTYLRQGAAYASTVAVTVDGHPWREVDSFFGQPADATVFVTREDETGKTVVSFGDGVNGARLPSGRDNVTASYRFGGGAATPAAGQLALVAQSFAGLKGVRNPVAASGGADPDPPDRVSRYAPRSVLTFGRAVSVADFEAIAAQAAAGDRVRAVWAWDDARQRTAVIIYVGGDLPTVATVRGVLGAAGDPNRSVTVTQAKAIPARLTLTMRAIAGMDTDAIAARVRAALTGEDGLFCADRLAIGQTLFESRIASACLAVDGVEAILACAFARWIGAGFKPEPGPLHATHDDGGYFQLDDDDLVIAMGAGDGG